MTSKEASGTRGIRVRRDRVEEANHWSSADVEQGMEEKI
jgi:hypothetical protein